MPTRIVWKLKDFLEQNNISAYRLQTDLGQQVGQDTIYKWVRKPPKRPDLDVFALILGKLSEYAGREVALDEILEVHYE